ncbi:DNA polymerase epsilon catalytic subunit A-like isoform X2 [Arachis duranensis]|uniref:DNA polymerase epsilon catalytic subunit n=1 Tax=Arachis duranensis TaxID=130453 RepID=A0A9C6WPJ4_ARADU|nr:DNA polymerase epsilon catalytic subunit A-like isoform X2 [Arachis duranensis]
MERKSKSKDDPSTSSSLPQIADDQHRGDDPWKFIKNACVALALDQSVQHDVLVMRKNVLKYVRVGEFAPGAEFRDQCHSFILSNVICGVEEVRKAVAMGLYGGSVGEGYGTAVFD